jgi:hypothetical protein
MQAISPVSSLPRPSPSAKSNKFKPNPFFQQLFQYQLVACHEGSALEIPRRNIYRLYEFLMKFNVFIYVVNSDESLPWGRSVLIAESAEMLETVRVYGARRVSFFDIEARAFCS